MTVGGWLLLIGASLDVASNRLSCVEWSKFDERGLECCRWCRLLMPRVRPAKRTAHPSVGVLVGMLSPLPGFGRVTHVPLSSGHATR